MVPKVVPEGAFYGQFWVFSQLGKNADFLRNGLGRVAVAAKPRKLRILLQISGK